MSVTKVLFDDRIKPKNVLALNEKVAAIRRYEADPVYKKIGRMFNCSPDQIKRIVKQKDEILAEWENRTRKPVPPTPHEIKTVRISVLGKAVHEWIRRIMYYTDFNLNDTLIQTMSLEFSKALKLPKFYPNKEWIQNFRATYNLPDANTKTMSIGYQESHSVQIRDILRYVKEVCGTKDVIVVDDGDNSRSSTGVTASIAEIEVEEIKKQTDKSNFYGDIVMKVEERNSKPSSSLTTQNVVMPEESPNADFSMQIDMDTTNYQPAQISQPQVEPEEMKTQIKTEPETMPTPAPKPASTAQEPEPQSKPEPQPEPETEPEPEPAPEEEPIAIYSHEAAISCVKLLEDFALMKENFRLIGLIERLEEALNEKSQK